MKRHFKVDFIIILLFGLLPLLLFGDVTLGNRTMLPVDNLFQWPPWTAVAAEIGLERPHNELISDLIIENYVWKQFIKESVRAGDIPLWNPYLFAGVPFLAAGQHGAYYPFSVLFLILPLAKAYGWYTLSQLWLAGVLMYVYGRVTGMRRSSAALAGLVYQGGGYLVVSAAVFPMVIGAVVWLPLLLACVEKVVRNGIARTGTTLLWAVTGAAALGAQILAGHIEFTIYTLVVMAVYGAWRLLSNQVSRQMARPFLWLSAMVLLGLMLGAIQLIPLYELGQTNFRQNDASFAEVRDFAFPPRRILTLVLPNFFGNPAHHTYVDVLSGETIPLAQNYHGAINPRGANTSVWGFKNYVEGGIYLGILPLFLALLGIVAGVRHNDHHRRRLTWFLVILSGLSLAFIFGTPLYAILYYGLPFANQLHTPFRWVFPFSFAIAALTGFGVDHLTATRRWQTIEAWRTIKQSPISNPQSPPTVWASDTSAPPWLRSLFLWAKPTLITLLAGLSFWSGLLLWVGLTASRWLYGRLEPFIERVFLGLALAADAFPSARAFYSYEYRQLFLLALMLVGVGAVLRVSRCPIFAGRWGGRRPLWLFMAAVLIALDIVAANAGFHAANDPALLDYKPEMVQWLQQQPGAWRLTSFTPHGDKPLNANLAWLFNLPDIRGYDSIIPKQYTDYMAAIEPQNELRFNKVQPIANWESLNSPLLDVLGVKYVITAETIDLPKYTLAWEGEGVRIYENLGVAPRAYTLPQMATAVVDDALAAMTELDPRQHVIVENNDWRLESEAISNLQSPVSPLQPALVQANGNREVVVETAVSEPSWLVLNDSYFPGWKAFLRPLAEESAPCFASPAAEVAEMETELTRVNGNFRGVTLAPGRWCVRFRYSPVSFQFGGLTSFMGGIILFFAVAVWGWRRFYAGDVALSKTKSIAKNSLAPIALNLFNKLIDFAFAAFYLRVLGPAGAGSYQTAIVTALLFDIISNFGLDILLIRDVSNERDKASHYLLNTTLLRLGAAVVATLPVVMIIAGTFLFDRANALTSAEIVATALIMLGMVFSGMSKGVTGLFYVNEEAEVPNSVTTVTTMMKVGFGVVALLLGYSFVGLAAVSILTNVITLAILFFLARRRYTLRGPWQIDRALMRQMVSAGYPLMLIHLLQTAFISIDTFLLRVMLTAEVAGWYSSAYKWFNALQIVPSYFTLALFPIISRQIKQSIDSARQMYGMAIKLMLLLALPVAAVTHFLAFPLVDILAGDAFLPHGAYALQIVIWSIPIGWMNSVTNYVLISLGLERRQPRAFMIGVSFNIIANLLFIPAFTYRAASVTTILSEVVLLIVFERYLRQRMPGVNWWRIVWRPFLITAVMFAAMQLGAQLNLWLGLALGILIYPAGLLLLRIIGPEERQVLASILPASIAARLKLV